MEKTYTLAEVKILIIEAFIYVMKQYGNPKIDINDFFKQQGL